eukprot:1172963-Amphidinium_carterae.1
MEEKWHALWESLATLCKLVHIGEKWIGQLYNIDMLPKSLPLFSLRTCTSFGGSNRFGRKGRQNSICQQRNCSEAGTPGTLLLGRDTPPNQLRSKHYYGTVFRYGLTVVCIFTDNNEYNIADKY